jgi:hypothetical protein
LDLLAKGWLRHVQPIGSMGKIQLLGGGDKIFQVAKFHLAAQLCPPAFGPPLHPDFVEPPEQQKDPLKNHTFAITESNGEPYKKSTGKLPEPGRLGSIR